MQLRAVLRLSVLALALCSVLPQDLPIRVVAKMVIPMVRKYVSSAVDKHMFTTTKIVTVATQLNFTALASAPGYAFKDHEKKTLVDIRPQRIESTLDTIEFSTIHNHTFDMSTVHRNMLLYAPTYQVAKHNYITTAMAHTEYSTNDWALETLTYRTTINQTFATIYNNTLARLLVMNKTYATDIVDNDLNFL